jgi:cytochrome P450
MAFSTLNVYVGSLAVTIVCAVVLRQWRARGRSRLPLPPGPAGLPIIGNLLSLPTKHTQAVYFHELGKKHGPIATVSVFGQPLIIVNSHAVALDLLNKRSPNYSDRPRAPLLELVDDSPAWQPKLILTASYDRTYRVHQRILASGMARFNDSKWRGLMMLESTQLLRDLLKESCKSSLPLDSHTVESHLERLQASLIFSLQFGFRLPTREDEKLRENFNIANLISTLASTQTILDLFPSLLALPSWLSPWDAWTKKAAVIERDLYPRNIAEGLNAPGWTLAKHAVEMGGRNGLSKHDVGYTLAGNANGGVETTPKAVMWFLVAASLYPTFFKTAQALLDEFVGRDRLPDFTDRAAIPFLEAIIWEVLRWRPIAPMGVPHRAAHEDEYDGFRIPANALVLANAWGIGRDETRFGSDVEDFVPERWLEGRDTRGKLRADLPVASFGYGRRTCLGKRLAEDGLWLQTARLMWAFDVSACDRNDESARVNSMAIDMPFFVITPGPFSLRLKARGPWVADVVGKSWDGAETDLTKLMGTWDKSSLFEE